MAEEGEVKKGKSIKGYINKVAKKFMYVVLGFILAGAIIWGVIEGVFKEVASAASSAMSSAKVSVRDNGGGKYSLDFDDEEIAAEIEERLKDIRH